MVGASVGIFTGAYAVIYMVLVAKMDLLAGEVVYIVWTALFTYSFSIMCGMISYVSSALFVKQIYSNIKAD